MARTEIMEITDKIEALSLKSKALHSNMAALDHAIFHGPDVKEAYELGYYLALETAREISEEIHELIKPLYHLTYGQKRKAFTGHDPMNATTEILKHSVI